MILTNFKKWHFSKKFNIFKESYFGKILINETIFRTCLNFEFKKLLELQHLDVNKVDQITPPSVPPSPLPAFITDSRI